MRQDSPSTVVGRAVAPPSQWSYSGPMLGLSSLLRAVPLCLGRVMKISTTRTINLIDLIAKYRHFHILFIMLLETYFPIRCNRRVNIISVFKVKLKPRL